MSRNLAETRCVHCGHDVELDEEPRPITAADAGLYFDEYEGMTVANAFCPACNAQYLAWIDQSTRKVHGGRKPDYGKITDLSYRSTFNDEPSPEDLPTYNVQRIELWLRIGRRDG